MLLKIAHSLHQKLLNIFVNNKLLIKDLKDGNAFVFFIGTGRFIFYNNFLENARISLKNSASSNFLFEEAVSELSDRKDSTLRN